MGFHFIGLAFQLLNGAKEEIQPAIMINPPRCDQRCDQIRMRKFALIIKWNQIQSHTKMDLPLVTIDQTNK
jgi:hypothetical protein